MWAFTKKNGQLVRTYSPRKITRLAADLISTSCTGVRRRFSRNGRVIHAMVQGIRIDPGHVLSRWFAMDTRGCVSGANAVKDCYPATPSDDGDCEPDTARSGFTILVMYVLY
ncbi:hypothetical protein Poly21_48080 [Allorhodopirellula heiligendammensis]|uniref:Uncharacterized protein n=1 Tax=Allorhodopirellula heiligendammensis TaxID=2714739 RepID=A0A5C6BGQ8_9BACT|nr:hypothetical protein Poly21_48080 [Allorhodopirellula heiligendammensis]